ncbi:MAG: penicillin-binding protein 2 [Paludibacteraceae bacterium]|nr:penicillin-binding protein 2 [Paludibacteraceae bacterium]
MINDNFYKRQYVISGMAIFVVIVYLVLLFNLQVIDQVTKGQAQGNAITQQAIYPARGLIYDRNDSLLVYNQPVYEVMMTMNEMQKDFDTLAFCRLLRIDKAMFDERILDLHDTRKNPGWSTYTQQVFMSQLKKEDIAQLQEELYKFHGVEIRNRTIRNYNCHEAAHILGSVGEVNWDDIKADDYYKMGDYSGRDGIERTYERELRGEKGIRKLLRDSKGKIQGRYKNGEDDVPAKAGKDLQLTIDIRLQQIAEQLLHGKIGSIVAIEPATGEVLALASAPTWDPQIMVGKERGKNYLHLLHDKSRPLFNRATQATYPPGSTFKTVQALVCLDDHVINQNTKYVCNGRASTPIKCTHSHGSPVALLGAIEQSCNPYFWNAFRDYLQKGNNGSKNSKKLHERYSQWRDAVMHFGLGSRFDDSDIYPQKGGNIPSEEYYNKRYGANGWIALTIRSLSIGQGEILVTPLQLANQTATIANGGYYITPHLNRNDSMKLRIHQTGIDRHYFELVKEGMGRVMTNGTGRHYSIEGVEICGKTGTAQNSHGKDHSIFIGFAPKENPKIAIAVVVENAGYGATWAVPIATLMMEYHLKGEIQHTDLFQRMSTSNTTQLNAKKE